MTNPARIGAAVSPGVALRRDVREHIVDATARFLDGRGRDRVVVRLPSRDTDRGEQQQRTEARATQPGGPPHDVPARRAGRTHRQPASGEVASEPAWREGGVTADTDGRA